MFFVFNIDILDMKIIIKVRYSVAKLSQVQQQSLLANILGANREKVKKITRIHSSF